jgi:hypothetical protein
MQILVSRTGSCPHPVVTELKVVQACAVLTNGCRRRCARKRSLSKLYQPTRASSSISELALVNVDYVSPSLWLGIILAVTGMVLYSLKIRNTSGTQEVDIVTASLFVTCGGVLILQGWRLDPTLMLSEGVLAAVSIYYVIQTVSLRKELEARLCKPRNTGLRLYDAPGVPSDTRVSHAGASWAASRCGQVGWASSRRAISSPI